MMFAIVLKDYSAPSHPLLRHLVFVYLRDDNPFCTIYRSPLRTICIFMRTSVLSTPCVETPW